MVRETLKREHASGHAFGYSQSPPTPHPPEPPLEPPHQICSDHLWATFSVVLVLLPIRLSFKRTIRQFSSGHTEKLTTDGSRQRGGYRQSALTVTMVTNADMKSAIAGAMEMSSCVHACVSQRNEDGL
ncbi:hypothetical protein Bbelb_201650 [Branchiostoma belcheri]|nr:hypothetical protein Bbelb_201650 [Branchiostoma belcheri]